MKKSLLLPIIALVIGASSFYAVSQVSATGQTNWHSTLIK